MARTTFHIATHVNKKQAHYRMKISCKSGSGHIMTSHDFQKQRNVAIRNDLQGTVIGCYSDAENIVFNIYELHACWRHYAVLITVRHIPTYMHEHDLYNHYALIKQRISSFSGLSKSPWLHWSNRVVPLSTRFHAIAHTCVYIFTYMHHITCIRHDSFLHGIQHRRVMRCTTASYAAHIAMWRHLGWRHDQAPYYCFAPAPSIYHAILYDVTK